MTSCRTYSPYGAWELKRTYQRNLLLANLCVVALVVAAIGIPSFLVKPPVAEVTSGGGELTPLKLWSIGSARPSSFVTAQVAR